MATFETVRKIALALPGVKEGTSYGTPAFRVGGKFIARLHDSREALVIRMGFDERAMRMAADPRTFFITDHYRDWPMVLVRLHSARADALRQLIEQRWRDVASKRLVTAFDGKRGKE